jgi:hypothetical protein
MELGKKKEIMRVWVKNGGKITKYKCNHCKSKIDCIRPTKDLISKNKKYWDNVKICSNCGKLNFVKIYPNGKTESYIIK